MGITLNREFVAQLKLPEGKSEVIVLDDTLRGFGVRIRRNSAGKVRKSWILQYRINSHQRREKIADVTPANADAARKRAENILAKVTLGQDPAAEKKAERVAKALTFSKAVSQYLDHKKEELRPSSWRVSKLYLTNRKYFGSLHAMPLTRIERSEIATCLNAIKGNSGLSSASRCRAHLHAMFVWALQEGMMGNGQNPVLGTRNPGNSPSRDRVLSNHELAAIWNACQDDDYGKIVKLLMLTGCRRQEIGGLRWSEIDLDAGTITLPKERTKNHRQHVLPLTDIMRSIIESVPRRIDRDHLFGARANGFAGWQTHHLDDGITKEWRLHDIRRTVATRMTDSPPDGLGILPHVVEAVINHASGHKAGAAGVYNHAPYKQDVKRALALWADHIDALVSGRESNVVVGDFSQQSA